MYIFKRICQFLIFNFSLLILLTACQPPVARSGFSASVVQILSGQAFEIAGIEKQPNIEQPDITERVRLEGIDVPDVAQAPWGEAAKKQLAKLLEQQSVRLESDIEPRDSTGQRLAYVWHNDELINETLVAGGYALVVPHPPNRKYDQRLTRAQDRARILGLGIWNPQMPMRQTPAEFRGDRSQE